MQLGATVEAVVKSLGGAAGAAPPQTSATSVGTHNAAGAIRVELRGPGTPLDAPAAQPRAARRDASSAQALLTSHDRRTSGLAV